MVDLNIELPENFLEEEVRCGHLVSKEMKELWAVQLDLLVKLLEVCKKHNIRIFAASGTMLGAVRHKGFIPWDDDIDMRILRADYKKLCKVAKEEFNPPYFFQTQQSDSGCLRGHAQLRNSQTTMMLREEIGKSDFNQGIFIDIFVMDYVPSDEKKFEQQVRKIEIYKKIAYGFSLMSTRMRRGKFKSIYKKTPFFYIILAFENLFYGRYEAWMKKYETGTETLGDLYWGVNWDVHKPLTYPAKFYDNEIMMPFENIEIPVSANYHELLTIEYGDYMVYVKNRNAHGSSQIDTENSYTEYLEGNLNE